MEKGKGRIAEVLSQEEILWYLRLVDRRLYIVMHSGIDWKPEYAQEMEDIDRELVVLRRKVDAAYAARQSLCHAAAEGASMESLPCAGTDPEDGAPTDDNCCAGCQYLESLDGMDGGEADCTAPDGIWGTDAVPCGDDLDRQKLKAEVRQAYLNGGCTEYLYDDDGNEYYTTRDGVRHYTRLEG